MPKKWDIRKIGSLFSKGSPGSGRHNCEDTLKKVQLVLDNELTAAEEEKFLNELNACSHCLEKYNIEKSFKEYLCNKIRRRTISATVADQIRHHISHITEE